MGVKVRQRRLGEGCVDGKGRAMHDTVCSRWDRYKSTFLLPSTGCTGGR